MGAARSTIPVHTTSKLPQTVPRENSKAVQMDLSPLHLIYPVIDYLDLVPIDYLHVHVYGGLSRARPPTVPPATRLGLTSAAPSPEG